MKKAFLALLVMTAVPAFASPAAPISKASDAVAYVGRVRCAAQNLRGGIFWETGVIRANVMERAMARCESRSLACHSLGCHVE